MTLFATLAVALAAAPLETASIDVERYLGTWYEIARYDHFFERDCVGVTATYSRLEGNDLRVINQCVKGTLEGPQKKVSGKAWIPDAKETGKLKVQFFWPFSGHYWILEVAPDYSWALVGDPDRKSCWILSRTPQVDEALYATLTQKLKDRGFEPDKLLRVAQRTP